MNKREVVGTAAFLISLGAILTGLIMWGALFVVLSGVSGVGTLLAVALRPRIVRAILSERDPTRLTPAQVKHASRVVRG